MTTLLTISVRLVAEQNVPSPLTGVGQIVNGHEVEDGDEVLLVGQLNAFENGPWVAHEGADWTRHADFATNTQMRRGTTFYVEEGGVGNEGSEWFFDSSNSGPESIQVGVTPLYFTRRSWPAPVGDGDGLAFDPENVVLGIAPRQEVQGTYVRPTVTYDDRAMPVYVQSGDVSEGFVEGLEVTRLSGSSYSVGEGSAWIPGGAGGEGELLIVDEPIVKSGLTGLPTNTWLYPYLFNNGGTPDVELLSQVPASPYYGHARVKGGPDNVDPDVEPDDTRRYIPRGAMRTDAAGTLIRIQRFPGGFTRWALSQLNTAAVRALSGGTNNLTQALDISQFCPATTVAIFVIATVSNTDNISAIFVAASGDSLQTVGTASGAGQLVVGSNPTSNSAGVISGPIALVDNVRTLHHYQSGIGGSRQTWIDIPGWWEAG